MAAICPDVEAPAVAPIEPAPPRVPTALPFSCNPMRRGLILPAPPPVTPGLYSRCATFSLGAVEALALSADGRFAAMVNGDGVARIVEIASQQVVALLAPPRARVTRVAFSPDGQRVATVAGGEHEVTVYSTNGWTPLWTVALPGTLYGYTDGFAGAITFSPDSQSLAVSPGANLYLLDLTGVVRASYTSLAILDVAYAWNGQRLVAADASLTGSCIRRPDGGSIVVLDPDSLTKLETVASWAGYSEDNVTPAFRASPTDDLVFVPPSTRDKVPTIQAFKLSDGSELPRPTLTTLPAAFLSNGNLVLAAGGELAVQPVQPVQPVSDATTVEVAVPTPEFPVFAVSADGSTVAVGSDGADLLHVWNVADDYALGVCTLDDTEPGLMSLSADGRAVALGVGGNVQVLCPDDGTPIGTVNGNGQPFQQLILSRTGPLRRRGRVPAPAPGRRSPHVRHRLSTDHRRPRRRLDRRSEPAQRLPRRIPVLARRDDLLRHLVPQRWSERGNAGEDRPRHWQGDRHPERADRYAADRIFARLPGAVRSGARRLPIL
jgi:hypothetical protein